MASLALGLAGAAIGSFAGPLGASLGWSIGAAIGGQIGGKSQKGPRLSDLRAQNSAYGQSIPIGYGTIRVAGNVIWAADLVEHKTKSGGKGGPKVTTYSYTQSFAVGLLETSYIDGAGVLANNPIAGILRVWADGRLVYGEGSDGAAFPMTIYYGTETQEADPTIEAEEGAGDVPAHRGMAYVVFTDLPLGGFGNRMPNLTFEVVASGSISLENYALWPVDYQFPIDGTPYASNEILSGVVRTGANELTLHRYRSGNDYGVSMGTGDDNVVYYDVRRYDLQGTLLGSEPQTSIFVGGAHAFVRPSINSGICYVYWNAGGGPGGYGYAWERDGIITYNAPAVDDWLPISGSPVYWNGYVYAAGELLSTDDMIIRRWPAADGAVYTGVYDPDLSFNADAQRTGYPTVSGWFADPGNIAIGTDGFIYWLVGYYAGAGDGTRLFKLDADLNLIDSWWSGSGATLPTAGYGITVWNGHIITYESAGIFDIGFANFILWQLNGDGTTTFVDEIAVPTNSITPLQFIGGNLSAHRFGILSLGNNQITLGEIVTNVSDHVGFDSSSVDVDQLTDLVRGYTITSRMAARSAIEALQPGYNFGAVESNLQAKFVKWGGQTVATVDAEDLGARDGDSDPVDPIVITHLDDRQLPQRIETIYLNLNMDYQEGSQYSARTESASDLNAAVTLPIVLVDSEAKAMADMLLFNAWIERDKFSFSLPRKWAHLEPTDVIALDGHAIRITNKDEQGYTHIKFEGVGTHTGVFVTAPVAPAPIGFVPQVPTTINKTDLVLLDIPLVIDTDFSNGFYAAIAGRMEGAWPGAGIFKSIDGGVNYNSIYSTVDRDTFGVATTAIGDFGGGNMFDESNSVTVRLTPGSGELSSSNELGVLNGANLAMLGDEMIQFKTATLVDTRTYTLTGLLRGRRGTDWALADHVIDEDFILLPCHNLEGAFAELGQERLYKAVSSGALLSSATTLPFTNTGVALKPYAPVLLGGGRNAAGDITLNWTRRTRIGGAWLDNIDVPLSEPFEQYTLVIFTDSGRGTVMTAFAVNDAQTYTYTAAAQTTDFGSPQATVYWKVGQNGLASEGYEAEGTT